MSDVNGAPPGEATTSVALPPDAPESFESAADAAAYFSELRAKPKKAAESAEEEPATAEQELPDEGNADPETAPSEEPDEAEPEEKLPPIDPPRSWTQAEKERFQSLPRETQEYLHSREQEREREFRRSQNEIAEERKAAKAERELAEKARQQNEAQLPALMQSLQDAQQAAFSDIKTLQDVENLQNSDPFRFQAWQVQQMKLQAVTAEADKALTQRTQKQQSEWAELVQKENAKASEFIPELADKVKGPALTQRVATELLPDLGFTDSELADLANGKTRLPIYDHRIQRLFADSLKLRDIQSAKTAVSAKPLPPVQRPGTAKPSGSGTSERIQALTRQLNETGDLKIAQELRQLQMRDRRAS